jgi:nucleotide-binding universal stress UspA family protein
MFKTILHANDGSRPAFWALELAIAVAKQNAAALHLVCVEEIPPMPEYIEEVREAKGIAARRFHRSSSARGFRPSKTASRYGSTS